MLPHASYDKPTCHHEPDPEEPAGYLAWMDWAENKSKTHTQTQCPECKLWVIWTKKTGGNDE